MSRDEHSPCEAPSRSTRRPPTPGITPYGLIDCVIAAVAWRHGATLLAQDADLTRVGRVIDLVVDEGDV